MADKENKTVQLSVRVTPTSFKRVNELCEEYGMSQGEVIERLLRYFEHFEEWRNSLVDARDGSDPDIDMDFILEHFMDADAPENLLSWMEGGLLCSHLPIETDREQIMAAKSLWSS